jgi:hypothetical protein
MRFFRRRERPAPPVHLVATWEPIHDRGIRAGPTVPFDYVAIRGAVLRHVPALAEAIRLEEEASAMHLEPTMPYVLIEDVVWPHLRRAAAVGSAEVRPYGALIAEMLDRGDRDVRGMAIIGLLEQIDHRRPVREALVAAGFARLLDELG